MWISKASLDLNERVTARWFVDGVEVATGSATVQFTREYDGDIQYLQSDLSTWGTSLNSIMLTYITGIGWTYPFRVIQSMTGYNIEVVKTHSDTMLPIQYEEHFVYDERDVTVPSGASIRGC